MKIQLYARRYGCLLMLLAPLFTQAQKSMAQKRDSMKREFMRMDSLRRLSVPQDTVKNVLTKSPFSVIYHVSKQGAPGVQQLSLQSARFRHSHFLNILLKAGLTKPISVSEQHKLYIEFTDNKTITLYSMGRASPKGNGTRSSSNFTLVYALPDKDLELLLSKKIVSVKIDYDGGNWIININDAASENIKKVCSFTK
ncbi:MAG: hypothetical protein JWR09_3160 [Mucilaginibacter sp.]|nr:hypothetical protein [Mucilaginibacter sp.]